MYTEREKSLLQHNHQYGQKMIMIVKTPGSQMGFPSSSTRRRRGKGRGEGGEWREKWSASEVDVGVDGAKSEIKVKRSCDPG